MAILRGLDFQKCQPKEILVETRGKVIGIYFLDCFFEEVCKLSGDYGNCDIYSSAKSTEFADFMKCIDAFWGLV